MKNLSPTRYSSKRKKAYVHITMTKVFIRVYSTVSSQRISTQSHYEPCLVCLKSWFNKVCTVSNNIKSLKNTMSFDIMFINYCFIYFKKHKVKSAFKKKLKLLFLMIMARKMHCSKQKLCKGSHISQRISLSFH